MSGTISAILAQLRGQFEELYGIRLIDLILFGSHAREDADPESDIDVLVVLEGSVEPGKEIRRTSALVTDLCLLHDVVISTVFMDKGQFETRQGPLLRNIRREGVSV
jgi:predicted nucleotidyltransferase